MTYQHAQDSIRVHIGSGEQGVLHQFDRVQNSVEKLNNIRYLRAQLIHQRLGKENGGIVGVAVGYACTLQGPVSGSIHLMSCPEHTDECPTCQGNVVRTAVLELRTSIPTNSPA